MVVTDTEPGRVPLVPVLSAVPCATSVVADADRGGTGAEGETSSAAGAAVLTSTGDVRLVSIVVGSVIVGATVAGDAISNSGASLAAPVEVVIFRCQGV